MCGGCRGRRQKNGGSAGAFICSQPGRRRGRAGGRRHTARALRLLQSGEAMAKGDQRVARSRVSDKGRKKVNHLLYSSARRLTVVEQ
jgi:hypothetical protein